MALHTCQKQEERTPSLEVVQYHCHVSIKRRADCAVAFGAYSFQQPQKRQLAVSNSMRTGPVWLHDNYSRKSWIEISILQAGIEWFSM